MITAIYRPITIRSKADATKFVNSFGGEAYIAFGKMDYQIVKEKGQFTAFVRPISERGNIFSPYWQDSTDPTEWAWKHRKMLNHWMNAEDERW